MHDWKRYHREIETLIQSADGDIDYQAIIRKSRQLRSAYLGQALHDAWRRVAGRMAGPVRGLYEKGNEPGYPLSGCRR